MQRFAIIVAGGSGSRMQSELPKQFIELQGQPILMHTIRAFNFGEIEITVVLPSSQVSFWKELCQKHDFKVSHQVIHGGQTRFESVKNGLDSIDASQGLVAIHDGVRPIIRKELIDHTYLQAAQYKSAITSVPLKDSIREIKNTSNIAKDRQQFRLIQTPQTFQIQALKKAFEVDYHPSFTDDASVFEHDGHAIHLINGDYRNIKITTPEDLLIAESFLRA